MSGRTRLIGWSGRCGAAIFFLFLCSLSRLAWAAPANDNYASAQVITGASGTVTGTNVGATKEPGEPDIGVPGGHSVWYSWAAPSSGAFYFRTTGSTFNTSMAIYTGTNFATLAAVTYNDDDPSGGVTSRTAFFATGGTTYHIGVDGKGGVTGSITLNWGPLPANDNFAGAQVISGAAGSVNGSNVGASREPGEPALANNPGGASVWYRWTAPGNGSVYFNTAGSNFDTLLGVFTLSGQGALLPIISNDDDPLGGTPASRVVFSATAGVTYYIAVDGAFASVNGSMGSITLTWSWTQFRPPTPTNLQASSFNNHIIFLHWDSVFGAASYNLYRARTSGGPYQLIASGLTTNNYWDNGLPSNIGYPMQEFQPGDLAFYVVTSVDPNGNESTPSNEAGAGVGGIPVGPDPPTGIMAAPANMAVTLNWTTHPGDVSYIVSRALNDPNGAYTNKTVPFSSTFTDTGLVNGATYYYKMTAVDANNNSTTNNNYVKAIPLASSPVNWRAVDIAVGTDNRTRLLWDNLDGRTVIWSLDSAFNYIFGPIYGPYTGYTAKTISGGGDTLSRVLWNRMDGTQSLWLMGETDPYNNVYETSFGYGPYSGWTMTDVGVGSDDRAHVLWTNVNGNVVVWSIDDQNNSAPGPAYGPYPGFTATAIASGADGLSRVLWTKTDGSAVLWLMGETNPYNNVYEASFGYGPFPGWTALDVAVGSDGKARLLWANADGRMVVWSVDDAGNMAAGPTYGPYPGFTAKRVAAGTDGITRILWYRADGATVVWTMAGDNTLISSSNPLGPY